MCNIKKLIVTTGEVEGGAFGARGMVTVTSKIEEVGQKFKARGVFGHGI